MTLTQATTRTIQAPGATLTYDVRPGSGGDVIPLFLIGSPMGAGGFGTLSSHFPERTVVTYDPRGSERSVKVDPSTESSPDEHADDLHRIIQELGGGPVDLFASSGGAVNALALVAKHPEDVRILVAHEPPLASVLPDRENAFGAVRWISDAYQQRGWGAGMAAFIAATSHEGAFPDDFPRRPEPDPAMFGLPGADDGMRTDVMLFQNIITCTHYEPNWEAIRNASTRIVLGVGAESNGQMAHRGAEAVAEKLGLRPVIFAGGHGGFLGGEYGQMGAPDEFAARLREVLAS